MDSRGSRERCEYLDCERRSREQRTGPREGTNEVSGLAGIVNQSQTCSLTLFAARDWQGSNPARFRIAPLALLLAAQNYGLAGVS